MNDPNLSLKECMAEKMEDIESILKQIVETIIIGKERSGGEPLSVLAGLYTEHESQLKSLLGGVAEHQSRQIQIDHLRQTVTERDSTIEQIEQCLRDTETSLTNAVFQANHKLKSIAQSESQKVNSEQLVRFAHRISRTNAVAAPHTWQQGDDQRPYPTQDELRKGALAMVDVHRHPTTSSAPMAMSVLRQQQQQHQQSHSPHQMMIRPSTSVGPLRGSPSLQHQQQQHYVAMQQQHQQSQQRATWNRATSFPSNVTPTVRTPRSGPTTPGIRQSSPRTTTGVLPIQPGLVL